MACFDTHFLTFRNFWYRAAMTLKLALQAWMPWQMHLRTSYSQIDLMHSKMWDIKFQGHSCLLSRVMITFFGTQNVSLSLLFWPLFSTFLTKIGIHWNFIKTKNTRYNGYLLLHSHFQASSLCFWQVIKVGNFLEKSSLILSIFRSKWDVLTLIFLTFTTFDREQIWPQNLLYKAVCHCKSIWELLILRVIWCSLRRGISSFKVIAAFFQELW